MAAVVEALEDERNLVIAGKKNRADMAREPNTAQVVAACGWETCRIPFDGGGGGVETLEDERKFRKLVIVGKKKPT